MKGPNPQSLRGVCMSSESAQSFLLATVSQESIVRVWNVLDEESYLLSLTDVDERLMGDKAMALGKFTNSNLKISVHPSYM